MAYGNIFPVNYSQYMPQQQYSQPVAQQQVGIIWVQGEAGAKSYMVAPNTTVQLWDSEDQVIYLKSADASGMPTMKILDYKIRDAGNQQSNTLMQTDYVTRDELTAFEEKIKQMVKGGINNAKSDIQSNEQ